MPKFHCTIAHLIRNDKSHWVQCVHGRHCFSKRRREVSFHYPKILNCLVEIFHSHFLYQRFNFFSFSRDDFPPCCFDMIVSDPLVEDLAVPVEQPALFLLYCKIDPFTPIGLHVEQLLSVFPLVI